jgi:hypothetical protein
MLDVPLFYFISTHLAHRDVFRQIQSGLFVCEIVGALKVTRSRITNSIKIFVLIQYKLSY